MRETEQALSYIKKQYLLNTATQRDYMFSRVRTSSMSITFSLEPGFGLGDFLLEISDFLIDQSFNGTRVDHDYCLEDESRNKTPTPE